MFLPRRLQCKLWKPHRGSSWYCVVFREEGEIIYSPGDLPVKLLLDDRSSKWVWFLRIWWVNEWCSVNMTLWLTFILTLVFFANVRVVANRYDRYVWIRFCRDFWKKNNVEGKITKNKYSFSKITFLVKLLFKCKIYFASPRI